MSQGRAQAASGGGAPREHIVLGPPTTKDLELGGGDPPPTTKDLELGGSDPPPTTKDLELGGSDPPPTTKDLELGGVDPPPTTKVCAPLEPPPQELCVPAHVS